MPPDISAEAFSWPLVSLGDGIEHLVRHAGLEPVAGEPMAVPDAVARDDGAELGRWVSWVADRMGIEAEPVDISAASVDALLVGGGPAVLRYDEASGPRFFLLVGSRFGKPQILCSDLRVRSCRIETLRTALCAARVSALTPEIDHLLQMAHVAPRRGREVGSLIARVRLGTDRIGRGWLLRLPPTTSFWRQIRHAGVPRKLTTMLGMFALVYAFEILGWTVIGSAALNGRLDLGWLVAWALLVLSIIPLRLVGGWFDAMLALDVSRLLKTRLLVGALQLDIETVRRQGVGQLLGRVIESQAFETLALNSGLASLVAVLELGFAGWVLSAGAAGTLHVALLLLWLLVAAGLSWRYFGRLDGWTRMRLDMTHGLVEKMVGHRTTLAQEPPDRRDRDDDAAMKDYVHASARLDHSAAPFLAGIPGGWTIVGLAGLVPAFVSGTGTPASLAISIGGILLAGRAFSGIASGLASAAGAAVAWTQIAPLYTAAARPASTLPFVPSEQMRARSVADVPSTLIDADSVTYRYESRAEPVLRGASLAIRHGEKLLIEGPSGGGKSTLAALLVGLRQPDSGLLLLNGLDRFTLGGAWHRFATEAPQFHENHVLSGTVGFNLLMGRNWPATDDELKEATDLCVELGLGDLLERMPAGMRQTVGETGWQLSHGERSRLFLARALLQNAQLTVLDESFAALDPESLETCLDAVMRRSQTLAVIAHP